MRGVRGGTLLKLLDFMYNGEVNVERANIKEFLQCGEELRVEGLCEKEVTSSSAPKPTSIVSRSDSITASNSQKEEALSPPPAPSTKHREKSERKKVRMEKKKRKIPQNVQKVEALPNIRANKRKENHVIQKQPPAPSITTEDPVPRRRSTTKCVELRARAC